MRYTNLVDLINHNDWILRLKSLQLFDKDAWLRVNVGALAALDVDGIVLASHGDHSGRAFQALADGLGNGCLADTRRTCE